MNKSVGAIIKNEKGEILLIDRVKPPFGWAGPAGHIEEDETSEEALIREVKEETGIQVLEYDLLLHEFVQWNECSKGGKGHDWYLFGVKEWEGEVKSNVEEAKGIKWVGKDQLKKFELEEVWDYWFRKIKIIQ